MYYIISDGLKKTKPIKSIRKAQALLRSLNILHDRKDGDLRPGGTFAISETFERL